MAIYAVGDLQGCVVPLEELLDKVQFDSEKDRLWLTGDLVNRGPHSLESLHLVKKLGKSAVTVLGNHDLHLLAQAEGLKGLKPGDTIKKVLKSPDRDELMHWLRNRPLVHFDDSMKTMMVHAGVCPGWKRWQLERYAGEVEKRLRGKRYTRLLQHMYGRHPAKWSEDMPKWQRTRFIINACTRMRYCDAKGRVNFTQKGPPGSQRKGLSPWFEHPDLKCKSWRIVFGHWSSLGLINTSRLVALDTGCVWGSKLSMVRLDSPDQALWQIGCPKVA
ncbi:MAG: symmetrical bis(5'-nucleosyl)-tetraphosphatase [Pseudomonadota bacterium]